MESSLKDNEDPLVVLPITSLNLYFFSLCETMNPNGLGSVEEVSTGSSYEHRF